MLSRKVCVSNYRSILSKNFRIARSLSAQPVGNFKPSEDEFSKALPYEEIPGLTKFELIKRFLLPGGEYRNKSMADIQTKMRKEFGDFYKLPGMFGQNTTLMTYAPDDVEFVHRNESAYPYRRSLETMKHFRKNIRSDVYSVGGLIVEQGEDWYKMRMAINPILMKPQIVSSYIPLIDSIVGDFMRNIPHIQNEKGEMPENFQDYLNRWSLESITAISLEKRLGLMNFKDKNESGMKIAKAVRKIILLGMEFEMKPSAWRYYETKRFKELLQAYDDLTELSSTIIEEAKKRYETGTFAGDQEQGILFKLLQKDKRIATVMAFDMIFGGIDTTTSALAFTLYCLAKHPDKQEKLRGELIGIMPSGDTPLNGENMKSLPYLRGVLKESLRLFPPAFANMRRTADNLVIRGYQVPKGVDIVLSMQHIYRDSSSFEKPNEFVPERWLRNPSEADACPHSMKQKHSFAYLPFGYGVRFCAGKRIAEMELEVFLSRFIRNHKVEWNHEDLKMKAAMVNLPDAPLKFKFTKI